MSRDWAVVVAAGKGRRMGADVPKQYLSIDGQPVLWHTLRALATSGCVAGLMVVLAEDDAHWPAWPDCDGVPIHTTHGGETRAQSVLNGLLALHGKAHTQDFVLVHDAARPLIAKADIQALIADTNEHKSGGLLAAPVTDTIKQAQAEQNVSAEVAHTVDRSLLWRALTPQRFRHGLLCEALRDAQSQGVAISDEAMAMERMGHAVALVRGRADNIKLTRPEDLPLLTWLLQQHKEHHA